MWHNILSCSMSVAGLGSLGRMVGARTVSLFLLARGSWLRCQFQTAVLSLRKSMMPWP